MNYNKKIGRRLYINLKKIICFILFTILGFSLFSTEDKETLKAIGHHDYPPWNWEKDGEIVGAAAEIVKELFDRINIETDFSYMGPWVRVQKYVETGVADVNICAFINLEREGYSKFIMTPMGFIEQAIFVKKGKEFNFDSWDDLKGKKIALLRGVSIGKEFDDFIAEYCKVYRANHYEQLFNLLRVGRIDAIAVGRYTGLAMMEKLHYADQFTDLEEPILVGNLYISFSLKSEFLDHLPQIEALIKEDGYYEWVDALLDKYIYIFSQTE